VANEKIINVKINGTIYKANAIKLKGNLKMYSLLDTKPLKLLDKQTLMDIDTYLNNPLRWAKKRKEIEDINNLIRKLK